ncbi:anoctamin-8-like isoform X2 [Sycon ciliatum]
MDNASLDSSLSVVIAFKRKASPEMQKWIQAKIAKDAPELIVESLRFTYRQRDALLVGISDEGMWIGAEEKMLEKKVKVEFGGGLRRFTVQDRECFVDSDSVRSFFSTSEVQAMIAYFLSNVRLAERETCDTYSFNPGTAVLPQCKVKGLVSQAFPLHSKAELESLRNRWAKRRIMTFSQPISACGGGSVRDYFGQKIAFYFSWLQFYTLSLIAPAVFGSLLYMTLYSTDDKAQEMKYQCAVAITLSLFNVIWSSVFLEMWKRRSSEIAYSWGVLESKLTCTDTINPYFKSTLGPCPVTGTMQLQPLSFVERAKRQCVTIPILLVALSVSIGAMLVTYRIRDYIETNYSRDSFVAAIPQIMLSVVIVGLSTIYRKLASWLTMYENHRLKLEFDNSLVTKLIVFQFINSFMTLFYIAFWRQDLDELKTQLAAFLVTRQLTSIAKEMALPYAKQYAKKVYLVEKSKQQQQQQQRDVSIDEEEDLEEGSGSGDSEETRTTLSTPELESVMGYYSDTVDDYMEMWIQFGYVVLFSGAFPLAGLLAFANNLLEMRTDSFKLCFSLQRPFAQDARDIGIWQLAFEILGYVAVAVNCAMLLVFGGFDQWLPGFTLIQIMVILVVVEHIFLAIKVAIMIVIPDVPLWVTMELARTHHVQQEALLREWRQSQERVSGGTGAATNEQHN